MPHGYGIPLGEAARRQLRGRLLRFAELAGIFTLCLLLSRWIAIHWLGRQLPDTPLWLGIANDAASVAVFWVFHTVVRRLPAIRPGPAVNTALALVALLGTLGVFRRSLGLDPQGYSLLATVLVAHAAGAALLPWTPIRTQLPIAWIVVVSVASLLLQGPPEPFGGDLGFTVATVLIGVPGVVIALLKAWRARDQFTIRFFQDRLQEVRQELVDARVIHEGAFPVPRNEGAVRFSYGYEPMRQIGGDYLHAHLHPAPAIEGAPPERREHERPLTVVSLDVTGHGIPAALTVNRLHGELSRIFAEQPDVHPGEAMRLLNKYTYLTLSGYGVFVAAFILRVDPAEGVLRYASAGFPAALLRSAGGAIVELPATATVLGVLEPGEFDPAQQIRPFHAGDTLVAFTDGAPEARSRSGADFGARRVRELVAEAPPDQPGRLPEAILRAVDRFRHGAPTDDTLVFEVYRPFSAPAPPRSDVGRRSAHARPAEAFAAPAGHDA